jgi:Thioredoxin
MGASWPRSVRGRHARRVERLVLALVLAGIALGVATLLQRRQRPDAPVRAGYAVPGQLDRHDFARPEVPWLVAVFSSATCTSCQGVWERAQPLDSPSVTVQQVEHQADRALHDRYAIEAVPTTLVADRDGVVVASFVGPVTASDLWAAVAEAREPGS